MTHLNVGFTVNWEGRGLDGVEALTRLRERHPGIPITHFVSAAYFARGGDYTEIIAAMLPAFAAHDEIGLLLNTWSSVHGSSPIAEREPQRVIRGDDPLLVVDHAGVDPQHDSGYTLALSSFPRHDIDALIRSSRLLLAPFLKHLVQRPGVSVDALLRGARAGHSMSSDTVLELLEQAGFDYDASAFDATWAQRRRDNVGDSPFGPWPGMLADLWGPDEHDDHLANHHCHAATAGTGVDWRTQPFRVLPDGRGELLELPLNGGFIPPVSPKHLTKIAGALAKLPSAAGVYLSFGVHQDTADHEFAAVIEECLSLLERDYEIRWSTLSTIVDGLLGKRPANPRAIVRPVPLRPPPRMRV